MQPNQLIITQDDIHHYLNYATHIVYMLSNKPITYIYYGWPVSDLHSIYMMISLSDSETVKYYKSKLYNLDQNKFKDIREHGTKGILDLHSQFQILKNTIPDTQIIKNYLIQNLDLMYFNPQHPILKLDPIHQTVFLNQYLLMNMVILNNNPIDKEFKKHFNMNNISELNNHNQELYSKIKDMILKL